MVEDMQDPQQGHLNQVRRYQQSDVPVEYKQYRGVMEDIQKTKCVIGPKVGGSLGLQVSVRILMWEK
jgi:hypothetical protein